MSKGSIVIIECISSAVNYIKDIRDEGYEPVLLEPFSKGLVRSYMRKLHDHELDTMMEPGEARPRILMAKPTYEETLAQMRELSPVVIIPGSDKGIELATKLSFDLGLVGNDPANLPKMRNKYICQQALKAAGVRAIESEMVETYEEALAFYHRMEKRGKAVVVKPASGISSMGVFVCSTEEELKSAFHSNKRNPIYTMYNGATGKVLIQECIDGEEYIVNSVSCQGVHKITSIRKSGKRVVPGKGKIYDYDMSIQKTDPLTNQLSQYQIQVLDIIGISYGAIHSEIMVDADGPVLIEANCRLCGANVKSSFFLETLGLSESQLSLQSYLYPNCFKDSPQTILFEDIKTFLIKYISLEKSTYITKLYLAEVFHTLPAYREYQIRKQHGLFSETVNLNTAFTKVFLACQNEESSDLINYLNDLQDNHPEKLYKCIDIPIICKIAGKLMA